MVYKRSAETEVELLTGLCLAVGTSDGMAKLMKTVGFDLNTDNPQIYCGVCLLLIPAPLVAMLIPALRAIRLNPI